VIRPPTTTTGPLHRHGIYRRTKCTSGEHVWIWNSGGENSECPPEKLCDCGCFRYDGRKVDVTDWKWLESEK